MKLRHNEEIIWNQAWMLNEKRKLGETVGGTVELIGARFELDPSQPYLDFPGVKATNAAYCMKELEWYQSMNLNVEFIEKYATLWNKIKSFNNEVNSNYGWCVWHNDNFEQWKFAIDALIRDKDTRQSCIIYTRPSMQFDYRRAAMKDFICTLNTSHFIRNNQLDYVVNMRSNDLIYGFFNDFFWHCWLYNEMYFKLKEFYPDLRGGRIIWMANSLHVYEKHYELLDRIANIKFRDREAQEAT